MNITEAKKTSQRDQKIDVLTGTAISKNNYQKDNVLIQAMI